MEAAVSGSLDELLLSIQQPHTAKGVVIRDRGQSSFAVDVGCRMDMTEMLEIVDVERVLLEMTYFDELERK